jgi:trehalose-6-phosphate synthase
MERIQRLKEKFKGVKVLVGVDRLDYIKGVPQKLHALEVFLSKHPEFHEKVRRGSNPVQITKTGILNVWYRWF